MSTAVASSLDATELRRQRGLAIAAICLIRPDGKDNRYIVPSQAGKGQYLVKIDSKKGSDWQCECQDFETRRLPCKHIFAVEFAIEREKNKDAGIIPEKPKTLAGKTAMAATTVAPRPTYKQNWPAYNAAQIHEKAKFQTLLAELCQGIPEPARNGKGTTGGRPPVPMADRVFAMALKVYSTQSGRRASTDMRDARDKGHLSHAPHYSKVSRFLEDPAMTPILTGLIAESARPLRSIESDFAIDSSGFATSRFVRWYDHKYGVVKHQYDWVKVSVCTGRTTNVVTAVEVDERYTADMTRFAPLLNATAKTFKIREVSADAAYLSLDNMELVTQHGGTPYIAFKSTSTGGCGGTLARMFHLYNFNRDEYLAHYHKRSNVESTFSMMKAKFGDALRSKTDTAMVNEALSKVLCHNLCCLIQSAYELGIEATFWGETANEQKQELEAVIVENGLEAWEWV